MNFNITVNYGSFENIEKAANSEKLINWWDDRDDRQQYCVECFAALEIIEHLKSANFNYLEDRAQTDKLKFLDSVEIEDTKSSHRSTNLQILIGKTVISSMNNDIPLAGRDGAYMSFLADGVWNVWIWGENGFSTLRAAYEWLQSLGIHWYTPDKHGTHIPKVLNFKEEEIVINYDYITRGCYNEFIDDDNPGFLDWAARNGMNMMRVQHFLSPHSVKKRGLQIMSGGHDIFYKYLNPNSEFPYVKETKDKKKSTYFDIHPEWFALIDGVRSPRDENIRATEGYYTGDNICTSNAEGVKELAKNMFVSMNEGSYQFCDYLNLWAYDNGTWCSCDGCKKLGNLSRRMLMLAYEINKIFKSAYDNGETHRRIRLVVPVYHETLEPPDIPLPDDFDYEYIISTFFPIERCYAHNIDDEGCTETNIRLKKVYEKWTDKFNGNYKGDIFIGEYYNVSSFASLPLVFTGTMKNDIPYYHRTGTRHLYYMHISARNWGMLLLNNCVLAGYLKSIKFDMEEFLDNFYTAFYPKTGKLMREFHNTLERASVNMKYLKHYQFTEGDKKLSLIGEITKEEKFPTKHCKYDYEIDDYNNDISFVETMKVLEKAKIQLEWALSTSYDVENDRINMEKMRFDYGYKVMNFIFHYVQLRLEVDKNNIEMIKRIFKKTESLRSELLEIKKPLEEMKYECPWYDNAYAATWHEKTYNELRETLRETYGLAMSSV